MPNFLISTSSVLSHLIFKSLRFSFIISLLYVKASFLLKQKKKKKKSNPQLILSAVSRESYVKYKLSHDPSYKFQISLSLPLWYISQPCSNTTPSLAPPPTSPMMPLALYLYPLRTFSILINFIYKILVYPSKWRQKPKLLSSEWSSYLISSRRPVLTVSAQDHITWPFLNYIENRQYSDYNNFATARSLVVYTLVRCSRQ